MTKPADANGEWRMTTTVLTQNSQFYDWFHELLAPIRANAIVWNKLVEECIGTVMQPGLITCLEQDFPAIWTAQQGRKKTITSADHEVDI